MVAAARPARERPGSFPACPATGMLEAMSACAGLVWMCRDVAVPRRGRIAFLLATGVLLAACRPAPTAHPIAPPPAQAAQHRPPTSTSLDPGSFVAAPPIPLPASRTPSPARVVTRGRTDRMAVTLTFDAGADRGHAAQVLDTLHAAHITAAFGITGQWAAANPDLVRRMAVEGHTLINHTSHHASFTGASAQPAARTREQRWTEIDGAERALADAAGTRGVPYFRPPYGDLDAGVVADVSARGYGWIVMWTVDSLGWQGLDAAAIVQRCVAAAEPGAIYIFHVGAASQDAAALPSIIDGLRARGYAIEPLPALLPDAS